MNQQFGEARAGMRVHPVSIRAVVG